MPAETYSISSKYKNVNTVADSIKSFCLSNGVSEPLCNDLIICVIEALNNVITHSYKKDDSKNIEVSVAFADSTFTVIIEDYGTARTNFEQPILDFDPGDIENLPEGGMGLFIIDNLMDKTSYSSDDGKNTFVMEKKLNR